MSIHQLTSTDAFVAFDLAEAPAIGVVRSAPKILQGGAKDLARSLTYSLAILGIERGGASAGINAKPEHRADAISAFVTEVSPMVTDGRLALDAAKGVDAGQLAALVDRDDREHNAFAPFAGDPLATHLAGLSPVVAADAALGGLGGKTVVIEGFTGHGPALAAAATGLGATVIALSTTDGMVVETDGFDPQDLRTKWDNSGAALVGEDAEPAWKVFSQQADIMFTGSKMGAIDHDTAANLGFGAVVPHSSLAYTARALAVMQRSDIVVLPDFVATLGPLTAYWATDSSPAAIIGQATEAIQSSVASAMAHEDGLFLGACYQAESFLASWRDQLPFGRPLAS